jgi:hypothetical protein
MFGRSYSNPVLGKAGKDMTSRKGSMKIAICFLVMLLPQVKRSSPRTVTFASNDYLEGFKLMRAIIALAGIAG